VRGADLLGRVVAGKFRIDSFVGGGAVGAVYRARQVALDKDVAVKILHGEHAGDATYAARFQREARAASRLDHPNSVRVLDFGQEPDGLLYIAMEFLDGRDLFHVIRQDWPLPPQRTADVLGQALAALAVAHDMGIVHRDLKPENIMMLTGTDDEGRPRDVVKVCDFGIAKFTEQRETGAGQKLTSQGIVVGTPEYMSPEQGKGEALDARSDLYAMGVILYQMLTGRVPFEAETAVGVVLKHVTEEAAAPRTINAGADPRLEAICLKAMRKKREDRYQAAREMRVDLRAVVRDRGGAHPLAHATTQRLAVPADVASAPTAVALDSGAVVAAPASTLTPAGTVTDAKALRPGRGRRFAFAGGGLALAVAAAVVWGTMASAPSTTAVLSGPVPSAAPPASSSASAPSPAAPLPPAPATAVQDSSTTGIQPGSSE
jgi:serine/threonine-protein kinase